MADKIPLRLEFDASGNPVALAEYQTGDTIAFSYLDGAAAAGHAHSGVYQPLDATLTALAGVTTAADKLIYATGADTFSTTDLTAAGRAILDDADAAAQRTTLGAAPTASPTFTGVASFPDGSVSAPSIANDGDANTGVYFPSADAVAITAGGTQRALFDANGITAPSYNGGQLAGFRNKIINGKMEVAQRGTSFAAIASGAYSLDRWVPFYTTSSAATVSQQADVPSNNEFQSSLRVAVTTADAAVATNDSFVLLQAIEGYNVRDIVGRTFTLSFWVRSSKIGIHCISMRNAALDRSYVVEYAINAANTWEYKTVTVTGGLITSGAWNWASGVGLYVNFTLVGGSTYQTTAGAWQTGNYTATSNQVNCLDSNTNIFAITGVQLEVGSVATPFEHRPYGAELALCQRYYTVKRTAVSTGTANATTHFAHMRATPTIESVTFDGGTGALFGALNLDALYQYANHSITATATLRLSAEL